MPYEIINRLRAPSLLRLTGAAATTNALPLTAFSANQAIENVNSLIVTSIKWTLQSTSSLVITRGAVVVATLYGSGDWKHDELNIANTATGTFTATITTGDGVALIGVRKDATYNVETYKL